MTQQSPPAIWDEGKVELLIDGEPVCANKYVIEKHLGSGGFGQVYLATERLTDQTLAIKRLCITSLLIEKFWERSVKSLFALGEHPHLIKFIDYAKERRLESGLEYYIVMEYATGGTLADEIARGYDSTAHAVRRFLELLDGVEFIHEKGYVHRDLKPENILIGADKRLKISDFDTGKVLDDKSFASSIVGTELYMAPEVLDGRATFLSDICSLGYVLAEMAAGRTLKDVASDMGSRGAIVELAPDAVRPVVSKMIEYVPADRYQSCGEIRDALSETLKKLEPKRVVKPEAGLTRAVKEEVVEVEEREPAPRAEPTRAVAEEAVEVEGPNEARARALHGASMSCLRCGYENPIEALFCAGCGHRFDKAKSAEKAVEAEEKPKRRQSSLIYILPLVVIALLAGYASYLSAIKPKMIERLLTRAEALMKDGNLDEAKALYREVLKLDPSNEAAKKGLLTSNWWYIYTIDSVGIESVESVVWCISIAIDSNNGVHISYLDYTNGDLKYTTNASGTWKIYTIDSEGDVGVDTSTAIDSNGRVHISYYDWGKSDLKYATNASGTWKVYTIDSEGDVGVDTSIAIDSSDRVHISYYDLTNKDLKYATNASGTWKIYTIDSEGDVGLYTSTAIDSNYRVHISYLDYTNGDLKYATNASGTWKIYTIDSEGDVGLYTSTAIDSNGRVHISYYDLTNKDLKYATNASGTWKIYTIDSEGDVGWNTSIAIDSSDRVYISYFDLTNGDLNYATNASGEWRTYTIDSEGFVGVDTSIAIDSNDRVHISYRDDTNGDLKYATTKPQK